MNKKLSLLLSLVLLVALSLPTFAATKLKQQEDGTFDVTFTYDENLDANEVFLAGEFNGWKASHPDWKMKKKDGAWKITINLEPGEYQYKFVVNGAEWHKDTEAEKFVDDGQGGQNSVVKALSNALKGEFQVSGDLTNTFKQEGEGAEVSFNNELNLRVKGTAYEKKGKKKIDRIKYDSKFKLESDLDSLDPADNVDIEMPSLDNAEIAKLDTTYLGDLFNVNMQVNTEDYTDSYDYLGLLDTASEKDNATSPNSFGDLQMLKVKANKGLDANAAIQEYENRKYVGYMNAKKSLKKFTGQDITIGSSAVVYHPKLMGKEEMNDAAEYGAVFGEYKPMENMTIKGEYAYVPTGNIDQNSFTVTENDDGSYTINFDLKAAIRSESDFDDKNPEDTSDYEKVVIIGGGSELDDWTEEVDRDYNYELNKQDDDGAEWQVTVSDQNKIDTLKNEKWKLMAIDEDEGDFHYAPSGMSNEKKMAGWIDLSKPPEELEDGSAYMAEANYKVIDKEASMKARLKAGDYSITKYQGEVTVGTKQVDKDAYLKLANDDFADVEDSGQVEYYADGYYDLTKKLEVTGDLLYKVAAEDYEADNDEDDVTEGDALNKKAKAGFDWNEPVAGLDYTKGHVTVDPEDTDDFDGEKQEVFAEAQTSAVPGFKSVMTNITQRLDSEVNDYYLEAELDTPFKQIAHVKGDVFYTANDKEDYFAGDNGLVEDAGLKYSVEGKVHHLPLVKDYITHLKTEYTSDEDGIIDNEDYDDDDNDWKNKLYAETKFTSPEVNNLSDKFTWDGLMVKGDFKQVEDDVIDYIPEELDQDEQYYVADDQQFIEWYSVTTFETGFDLPYETTADLTVKYDMSHGEVSEYEDDALLVKLTNKLNSRTDVTASYNKQDEDNGEDYTEIKVKTSF